MDVRFPSGWGNEVLYRMCREEPRHSNPDIVSGKIWLIGRAYAAAVERGAGKAREQGKDLHDIIAPKISESDLDKWLASVEDVKSVDMQNLNRVLSVHYKFTVLLKELTELKRRSFASKYLHFHNPNAFFIYDSRAAMEIRRKVGRHRFDIPRSCIEADETYAGFVLRCIEFRNAEAAKSNGTQMTPRQLDQTLLGYGSP